MEKLIYRHALDNRYRYIGFADIGYIGRYLISADTDMPTLVSDHQTRKFSNEQCPWILLIRRSIFEAWSKFFERRFTVSTLMILKSGMNSMSASKGIRGFSISIFQNISSYVSLEDIHHQWVRNSFVTNLWRVKNNTKADHITLHCIFHEGHVSRALSFPSRGDHHLILLRATGQRSPWPRVAGEAMVFSPNRFNFTGSMRTPAYSHEGEGTPWSMLSWYMYIVMTTNELCTSNDNTNIMSTTFWSRRQAYCHCTENKSIKLQCLKGLLGGINGFKMVIVATRPTGQMWWRWGPLCILQPLTCFLWLSNVCCTNLETVTNIAI